PHGALQPEPGDQMTNPSKPSNQPDVSNESGQASQSHHPTPPDYNQYGMKDEDAKATDVYANRPGGEEPVVGPKDAVDSSGHRQGAVEEHPFQKPSSRTGQAVFGEIDDMKR